MRPEEEAMAETTVQRGQRKERVGRVLSRKMAKTVIVAVETREPHPLYGKEIRRVRKLYAHDEDERAREGDTVRIMETRPLSRLKRWRVVEILRRAEPGREEERL
jgi:small subunit ribosomal protein S17